MRSRSHPDHRSSPRRRRLAAGALTTAVALAAGAVVAAPAHAADPVTIDLVTVNDFHGRIEASPLTTGGPLGGIAALGVAVDQIRASNPNTLFAAAGDMIGASTFTSFIQDDEPTIETLDAAGLDVSAAGNHEFDRGWDDLRVRVQDLADYEYISANVFDTTTGEPALAPTWTKTVGGISVGFIGAVTEELPFLVNPAGIADLEVRDIVDSVNAAADDLTDSDPANGEADVIVLLVHEGAADTDLETATDPNNAFGAIVNGVSDKVNAIVSGHTHLAYNHEVPYGGDTGIRPVISSGQYGEKFSDMKIVVDPDTKQILSMENETIDMWWDDDSNPDTIRVPRYAVPPGDPIAAMVAAAVEAAEEPGSVPLGEIDADLLRGRQPKLGDGVPTGGTDESRGVESTLGNFVADVQLWSAREADPSTQIAFMNPGGLRADLLFAPDGVVTYAEAAGVQPFANTLVTVTLTGAQIRAALEQQWQPTGSSRPFLKLGVSKGLEYTYDPDAAPLAHIGQITLDEVPIEPAASYRVVVNSFLAAGGDNFGAFLEGTEKDDTGKVDLESMVDYLDAHPGVSPDLAQRSIGVRLSPPGANGYAAGSTIDVQLWGLEFTNSTEPAAGTVEVAIAGTPVGSQAIDRTLQLAYDLVGQSTLQVTVPDGVSGVVPLSITTPTGTSIDVPITVYGKVESTTRAWPDRFIALRGTEVQYTVRVLADGVVPTGVVTIYDRSSAIATVTLTEADGGRVKVTLPPLDRGLHLLWAKYEGSDLVDGSQAPRLPVFVWR